MVLEQERPDRTVQPGDGLRHRPTMCWPAAAFPFRVKGAGVIGVIAVSGLPERQDHGVIVDALCDHLGTGSRCEWRWRLPPDRDEVARHGAIDPKAFLTSIFEAAVAAADPERRSAIICRRSRRAAPSSSAPARARRRWRRRSRRPGTGRSKGVVVTRYGYAAPCERIEVIEAAHPVPDAAGLEASKRLLETVSGLTADDLVVALISGGGSALLPSPRRRPDACRRDRRQRGAACLRRADRGDEHDAQACLDDQGRTARRRRLAGQGGLAGRLGHSRRQSGAGRFRPDHPGRRQPRRRAGASSPPTA